MPASIPRLPEPAPSGGAEAGYLLAFAAWAVFFCSRDFTAGVAKIDDGAQYLLIAKGFAQGLGYANLALPGVPAFVALPSAFPLMLAPYWWFLAPHEGVLRGLLAVGMASGGWLSFLWLRSVLPRWQAFLAAVPFVANIQFVILSTSVMSEAPTVLCLYAGLYCYGKDEAAARRGAWGWLALAAWLVLFRLRINTSPFFLLYLALLARRREWRKAAAGSGAGLAWLALERYWARHLPDAGGGYVQYGLVQDYSMDRVPWLRALARAAANYAEHLYGYVGGVFGRELLPWFYHMHTMDKPKRLVLLALSAWCLAGLAVFWKRYPRRRWIAAAFAFQWLPIFLYVRTLDRYMLPSLPFLIACMALAADAAGRRAGTGAARAAVIAFFGIVLLNQAVWSAGFKAHWDWWDDERIAYKRIHDYIRRAPVKPDLVVSAHHYYTYLATGVPSADWDIQWDYALAHGMAEGKRVWAYFIVPGPGAERSRPLGAGYCLGAAPLVQADPYHSLWELAPCPPAGGEDTMER